ncbi:hypothetical protein [Christensenella intestinihominis]|uniref:hypothetical protein n=2 Tax=Christensenella intestinihominis TaxID=1851429 RepID=UPI0009F1F1F4|nr:hypothetical protein [Christensenella intestinihominis]
MKRKIYAILIAVLIVSASMGCGVEKAPQNPDKNASSKIAVGPSIITAVTGEGKILTAGFSRGAGMDKYKTDGWKDIRQITAGGTHTAGLRKDGTVVAAGDNRYGQCDVGNWKDVQQIAAGFAETTALFNDGTLGTTNPERKKELETARDVVAISCDPVMESIAALKRDGTVEVFTQDDEMAREVKSWKDIKQISAGLNYIAALTNEGTVLIAGGTEAGKRAGEGNVGHWTEIAYVAAGEYRTWGIKTDGTVLSTDFYDPDKILGNLPDFAETKEWTDIVTLEPSADLVVGLKKDGTIVLAGNISDSERKAELWKDIKDWTY